MSGTSYHELLSTAEGQVYDDIRSKVAGADTLYDNNMQGIERCLNDPRYVFLVEKLFYKSIQTQYPNLNIKKCDLIRAQEELFPAMFGFPFRKNSPYVRAFSTQ